MKLFLNYLLPLILLYFCSCTTHKEKRLLVSGINSSFDFDTTKSFETYVDYSIKMIQSARVDLNTMDREKIISWNAPFILNADSKRCKTKKGILLIHGLTDSPFSTREIATYFNQKCFTVYSLLLTGHGTRPGDLRKVSYKDWTNQVLYAVKQLSKKSDEIYLGGFSTGAALTINYLLSNPSEKIHGIIALSPALNLKSIAIVTPILKYLKTYLYVCKDETMVKYESVASNAATQVYLLTKQIAKKIRKDNTPLKKVRIFAALTYEDQIIDPLKSLNTLLENTQSDKRHITLYHKEPLPETILSQQNLYPVQATIKEDNILNLSHISIPIGPENIVLGKNTSYRDCLKYYKHKSRNENYELCKSSPNIYYGETTKDNLKLGIVARLSYNPFMNELFADVGNFFDL